MTFIDAWEVGSWTVERMDRKENNTGTTLWCPGMFPGGTRGEDGGAVLRSQSYQVPSLFHILLYPALQARLKSPPQQMALGRGREVFTEAAADRLRAPSIASHSSILRRPPGSGAPVARRISACGQRNPRVSVDFPAHALRRRATRPPSPPSRASAPRSGVPTQSRAPR